MVQYPDVSGKERLQGAGIAESHPRHGPRSLVTLSIYQASSESIIVPESGALQATQ